MGRESRAAQFSSYVLRSDLHLRDVFFATPESEGVGTAGQHSDACGLRNWSQQIHGHKIVSARTGDVAFDDVRVRGGLVGVAGEYDGANGVGYGHAGPAVVNLTVD